MAKPSNTTYYVDCTGNQKLRDELLDYAVERGAKELYDRSIYSRTHAWMDLEEKAVFASAGEPEPITPATWKRKVRKIWGGLNPSKPRIKGRFAPKPKEPTQLDRIEGYLNKVGQAVIDQGREFKSSLNRIESSVADRLDALRMEQYSLAQDTAIDPLMNNGIVDPRPASLRPGDYCDASKEVADELTAMGFKWYMDNFDHPDLPCIVWAGDKWSHLSNSMFRSMPSNEFTHLDRPTFLSRARVTAKELGLKPVEAPAEVWVPKVGDWVVALPIKDRTGTLGGALDVGHEPIEVSQIDTTSCGSGRAVLVSKPPRPLHIDCRNFRKATDAEVAEAIAKRKEAERAEKVKALKFGVRVMTPEGSEGVYINTPAVGGCRIAFPSGHVRNYTLDQLTPIEP